MVILKNIQLTISCRNIEFTISCSYYCYCNVLWALSDHSFFLQNFGFKVGQYLYDSVHQRWPTGSPRAACGPPRGSMWPASQFGKCKKNVISFKNQVFLGPL